jgi:hypothetical protein
MTAKLTKQTLHKRLVKDCLGGQISEGDSLLWMVLLHTHEIRLHPGIIEDGNGAVTAFCPITQRHAASVVAKLWGELMHERGKRSDYFYWYFRFNTETPYEVVSDVPDTLLPRLAELRQALARDPRVASVTPED